MTRHGTDLPCPACHGAMQVAALGCERCELRVEGAFTVNEFARLPPEQLQLLRVFVHCEGSIRDMEKALGISYPTVKARLAQLRAALGMADAAPPPRRDVADVLDALERGELDAKAAAAALRQRNER